jgi:hypothetical protein
VKLERGEVDYETLSLKLRDEAGQDLVVDVGSLSTRSSPLVVFPIIPNTKVFQLLLIAGGQTHDLLQVLGRQVI